jgi:hypothetical protein
MLRAYSIRMIVSAFDHLCRKDRCDEGDDMVHKLRSRSLIYEIRYVVAGREHATNLSDSGPAVVPHCASPTCGTEPLKRGSMDLLQ